MSKCFRCSTTEETGGEFDHKTPTTPSTVCLKCFDELKTAGHKFLHERAKVEQDDPNYDVMKDGDYIKQWNKAHPIRIGNPYQ
jgi:hypothetical protein